MGGLRGDYKVLPYNKGLKTFARELRRNQTEAETFLWLKLMKRQLKGCQFYRQRIICNYIVDFYCPDAKLVIEIDGGQHYSEPGLAKDSLRDQHLSELGLRIMRISAREVFANTEGVLEAIYQQLP
jgi:very-short-patch-repair endonuclease